MKNYDYYRLMKLAADVAQDEEMSQKEQRKEDRKQRREQKREERAYNKLVNKQTSSGRKLRGQVHSQRWGHLTSPLILAALGALAGTGFGIYTGKKAQNQWDDNNTVMPGGAGWPHNPTDDQRPALWAHMLAGATLGAGAGGLLGAGANAIGGAAGWLGGPRSLKKQVDYDSSLGANISNYLVPGAAGFNLARTQATEDEERAMLRQYLLAKAKEAKGLV